MKKVFYLGCAAVFSFAIAFTKPDEQLNRLLARLDKLTTDAPQEKVHLQFDKPYYSLGEDIWLKAYVVDAENNNLSNRSKILYVDLLDERDSVKKTLLLPLVNGMADANITLSDSLLTAGNYHIYAYTKWMQNFSSDFFFRKSIPIVNALKGAVSGELEYKAIVNDKGKQLTSDITFKRDNGTTYNNLQVDYTVSADGKIIATAKGVTSLDGKLTIVTNLKKDDKEAVITINTTANLQGGHIASQVFVIKPLAGTADVQFFPEGGQMVTGIRTKVGFKAIKPDGSSEAISGYIIDESNEQVAEFKSEHAGMGVFALAPVPGKTYTAVIRHDDASESRVSLPPAQQSGYVLNVNHIGKDSLSVRVSASPTLANGQEVILVAQCNGVVQFVGKPKLDQASTVNIISTKKFPTGIAHITLFTPDYAPIAERLVFVDHNDHLQANVNADKATYDKRGKVKLDIKITNAFNEPVVGSFSVAVTDGNRVKQDEDNETSILSNLLLTSDIRGYIEKPNYYFNEVNPDRSKHLDHLLLTQGWRRFTWAELLGENFPAIKYQPEQSLAVSGSVTTLGNKPLANGKVNLFAKTAEGPMIVDTATDANGRFTFTDLYFPDSAKILVRATNIKGNTTVKTTIDRKPRITYTPFYNATDAVKGTNLADYMKYTQEQFNEMTKFGLVKNATALREVKIKAPKIFNADKIVANSANLSPGLSNKVLRSEELERQSNLLNAFYGVPGLYIKNGAVISARTDNKMKVLLDGVEIQPEFIDRIPPSQVAAVEILTSLSYASIYQAKGVLIITSKKGTEGIITLPSTHVQHYVPQGYATVKQFYAPEYDTPSKNDKMADLRSTIYWNANIVTNTDGKASLTYFNADGAGTYKVTLEGMDTKGKLLRKTFTYAVNN